LTGCDAPGLGAAGQAEALAALERAEAKHTAVRAKILSAFGAGRGFEADGHYGPKPWLRAVTRVTKGAAAGAASWARRLQAHPAIADALAAGAISASWAKEICTWTEQLPEDKRTDADQILLAAATGGADLYDLAALAREMRDRSRTTPDPDADRDFTDRELRLETTLGGAGHLAGDLTPGCAAAPSAVLDALSGKAGPEDTRTLPQRRHDALEEALQRLIAARMVPSRHGEPVHVQVHVDLAALRGLPGASGLEAAWAAARTGTSGGAADNGDGGEGGGGGGAGNGGTAASSTAGISGGSGWSPARAAAGPGSCYLTGAAAEAAACDATIIPVVTGQIDGAALDQLTEIFLAAHGLAYPARIPLSPAVRQRLQHTLLQLGTDLVSGPGGLASYLRARLLGHPYTGASQPLDLGAPTPEIPPHLRRAVILRDKCCQFPGCFQPPSVCQVHHLIPRSKGGRTALGNLRLLCRFHHLVVIHRWGWTLTCHSDGTITATSPDGRTLHSYSPPGQAA
ncbi:MAG TPA: DUF222 domain-containing protein, partial [Streptosporangiaceae bacterium]|nr:DUF222 domain-containing protein [Streptosporangiaceae bacterium]